MKVVIVRRVYSVWCIFATWLGNFTTNFIDIYVIVIWSIITHLQFSLLKFVLRTLNMILTVISAKSCDHKIICKESKMYLKEENQ